MRLFIFSQTINYMNHHRQLSLECSDLSPYHTNTTHDFIYSSQLIQNHFDMFPDENIMKCPYTFQQITDLFIYLSSSSRSVYLENISLSLFKKYSPSLIVEIFEFFMFDNGLYRYHEALYIGLRQLGDLPPIFNLSREQHFSWLNSDEALLIQSDYHHNNTIDFNNDDSYNRLCILDLINNIHSELSKFENLTNSNNCDNQLSDYDSDDSDTDHIDYLMEDMTLINSKFRNLFSISNSSPQ